MTPRLDSHLPAYAPAPRSSTWNASSDFTGSRLSDYQLVIFNDWDLESLGRPR